MNEIIPKSITKAMWDDIESEMSGSWVNIVFRYQNHEVSVGRARISESRTCLQVYVDGFIKGEWVSFNHGQNGLSDKAPKILADVWCKKTKAKFDSKFKARILKIWGKRKAKIEYPDLDEKRIFYVPEFSKASVLCRQLKKLDGIELVKAMFLDLKEEAQ